MKDVNLKEFYLELVNTKVKDGLFFEWVKELQVNFVKYIEADDHDGLSYASGILKAIKKSMDALEKGLPFDDVVDWSDIGLSGFQASLCVHAVSFYSEKGDEFKKEWNLRAGGTGEETEIIF